MPKRPREAEADSASAAATAEEERVPLFDDDDDDEEEEEVEEETEEGGEEETKATEEEEEEEEERGRKFDDERTVFVGRLNRAASEADVRSLFSNSGRISRVNMPVHADSGRPMGIAYVEFEHDASVQVACRLDGRKFMDAAIKVKPAALPQAHGERWRKGDLARADDSCTVHVGNLSYATDEATLRREFARAGEVVRVNIPLWHDTGRKRGFALVEFASRGAVAAAVRALDGKTIDGRVVHVGPYSPLSLAKINRHRALSRKKINPCHGLQGPAARRQRRDPSN